MYDQSVQFYDGNAFNVAYGIPGDVCTHSKGMKLKDFVLDVVEKDEEGAEEKA